jgi:hypothetical protein
MKKTYIGHERWLTNPVTGKKVLNSIVEGEIYHPPSGKPPHKYPFGKYHFGVWLERTTKDGLLLISFPYWRKGRFAGRTTLRAEPWIIKDLFKEMNRRGWLDK